MSCIVYYCTVTILTLLTTWFLWLSLGRRRKNVCAVVLGDIGRSPRMQYHAVSFLKEGFTVDIVGYPGSMPLKELNQSSTVKISYLQPSPNLQNGVPRVISLAVKVLWQTGTLFLALFLRRPSTHLILQNPPAVPTIPVCWFYCFVTRTHFTIDWHNYAHTLMAINLGKDHLFVLLTELIESIFGKLSHNNFCVTKAMKDDLRKRWNIQAEVLYDRPPDEFHPITIEEKHNLLLRLSKTYNAFKGDSEESTILTECSPDGKISLRARRPGFIVSSTSWTEDEDFSILLNALAEYEGVCEMGEMNLPDLLCVITGKGPLKEFYIAIIELKKWKHVKIVTPWLENEDYPKLLASADLGICLHTSSSGLDLPMKVVDMFGCNLPVCAFDFKCLGELVKHNENGFVFANGKELTKQLKTWFINFPNNPEQQKLVEKFKQELEQFLQLRWHGNWSLKVLPCFPCES